jgi:DnaK suppressor protein
LIARRNALRVSLEGELDGLGKETQVNGVGDEIDAAVDTASEEIRSQIVELESKELAD